MGMDAKNEEKNAPELKHWSEKKFDFPPVQIQMMSHEQGSMLRLYQIKCELLQCRSDGSSAVLCSGPGGRYEYYSLPSPAAAGCNSAG